MIAIVILVLVIVFFNIYEKGDAGESINYDEVKSLLGNRSLNEAGDSTGDSWS